MTDSKALVRKLVRLSKPKSDRLGRMRLDLNERVIGFPEAITRDVIASLPDDFLTAYPETQRLYDMLAAHHGVAAENVAIAAGSELAIRYVLEAYLGENDGLVILDPSFAMFEVYGRICGARITAVPFPSSLQTPLDALLAAITPGTKVVAIANPNNPTGTVLTRDELLRIIERAGSVGAICIVDEAYYYFHNETMADLVPSIEHLVVTRTFSKACGLASVRLGYALGHARVISEIQKLQPIDHASGFAVEYGAYMVEHEDVVWRYAGDVRAGREFVTSSLRALGFKVIDSASNFLLVDGGPDRDALVARLKERGILVSTSLRLPFEHSYLRVSVGPADYMAAFIKEVRAFVSQHHSTGV